MDLSGDWGDVADELISNTLADRGITSDRSANPEGILRLRTLLLAMLYSDSGVATACFLERLITERMGILNDVQLWMSLHDPDIDHVERSRLIQAIDPMAPPSVG
ncbi:MAG: hypothetical protein CBC35_03280 [Planctomycetes bacterium TMED75]|nr:hypothetical protein [Planctomycetaceae bacterium]OUU94922.1 MAG: hypothetical protein CBC35_03280 [Planctomycetes bacterium TMED75]